MRLSSKVAALEFSGDRLRVAVVKTSGRKAQILEMHSVRVDPGADEERHDALVAAAHELLEKLSGGIAAYVLCVSVGDCAVRTLTIPFKGKWRVASAVRFELEPYLAFPIEELVVDHVTVRDVEGETEVLAVALRKAAVADLVSALAEAGLQLDGIALDVAGLTELWRMARKPSAGLHAVLHVRADEVALALVYGKKLAGLRTLRGTATVVHENAQAVAREVANTLRAVRSQWADFRLDSFTVTGADLFEEQRGLFEDELRRQLRLEEERGDSLEFHYIDLLKDIAGLPEGQRVLEREDDRFDDGPDSWAALAGVAVNAASSSESFDFLKEDLRIRNPFRAMMPQLVLTAILAGVLLIGFVGYCFVDYQRNIGRARRIGDQIWDTYVEAFPDADNAQSRPPGDLGGQVSYELMAAEMTEAIETRKAFSLDLFTKPTLLDILREISAAMPEEQVKVQEIRMTGARTPEVMIRGEVKDSNSFSQVLETLQQSSTLRLEGTPRREVRHGVETFEVRAEVRSQQESDHQ